MPYPLLRKTIISCLQEDYSWMDLGHLSKELRLKGIDYKELGFNKAIHLIHTLKGFIEIKFKESPTGKQCFVRKNPEQRASESRNAQWEEIEIKYKMLSNKRVAGRKDRRSDQVEQSTISDSRRTVKRVLLKPNLSRDSHLSNFLPSNPGIYSSSRYPITTSCSIWVIYTPMGNGMR